MEERLLAAVPPLLAWYRVCKRELPWRGETDFYRILVSEIMLQQTRVEAVKGYYTRFLEKFPTASTLAAASEEETLKAWEGLGYYSRARNLRRAAQVIAERGVPASYEEVRALPGVGDYTAGSLSSIALGLPCPAVDGNVLRVLSRLLADPDNTDDSATKKKFAAMLKRAYPPETADFCQALMELGALVCVPGGAPLCGGCPWETLCLAHLEGREENFPVRSEKRARKIVSLHVYVLRCGGKYALRRRGEGLLAGMWEFPNSEREQSFGQEAEQKRATHVFTHVEWRMTGHLVDVRARSPEYVWATTEEIRKNYAVPSAFKAFAEWLK